MEPSATRKTTTFVSSLSIILKARGTPWHNPPVLCGFRHTQDHCLEGKWKRKQKNVIVANCPDLGGTVPIFGGLSRFVLRPDFVPISVVYPDFLNKINTTQALPKD